MPVATKEIITLRELPESAEPDDNTGYFLLTIVLLTTIGVVLFLVPYNYQLIEGKYNSEIYQAESRYKSALMKIYELSEENLRLRRVINSEPKTIMTGREVLGYAY